MSFAELGYLESNIQIPYFIDSLIEERRERKKHPDYLAVNGLICFCGSQGSGKTLSAVQYIHNLALRYPKMLIVSNVALYFNDVKNKIIDYTGVDQLLTVDNGKFGVLFFIDEMHIEFNSLESKGMDSNIFELVSQQRKRRVHIVGTSQVFARLAKPFREQFKMCVVCDKVFGSLFRQAVYQSKNMAFDEDIRSVLNPECVKFYFASPEMFNMYDTLQVIERSRKTWTQTR